MGQVGSEGERTQEQELLAAEAHFHNACMAVDDGVTFSDDQAKALREALGQMRLSVLAELRAYDMARFGVKAEQEGGK